MENTMKTSACLNIFLTLTLCLSPSICAVQSPPSDCDILRSKVAQLENLNIDDMSPTLRKLYKESLLKIYQEFSECLRREVSIASRMNNAVANTGAANEVDRRLQALLKEKTDIDGKITIMRTALDLPAAEIASNADSGDAAGRMGTRGANPLTSRARVGPNRPADPDAASVRRASANPVTPNCGPSAAYDDAPGILKDLATSLATDIINENDPDKAAQAGPQMVLYTVFDSASPKSSELVRSLEAYHYLGETARTDKQLGASANSDGAVSALEKPGFAQLLGFAVEHGGIAKQNDGTNVTLSTSLYSLYALGTKDTAENYARAGVLNRVGLAATFAAENKTNDLANARRNNLSEWSAKIRLFGDRSTRSPGFRKVFDEKVRPLIRDRLRTLGRSIEELANKNPGYGTLEDNALDTLPDEVRARIACPDYASATAEQKQKIISGVILGRLRTAVYEPLSTRSFRLGDDEIARIEGEFLPNLKKSLDNLVLADGILKQAVADLQKGPLATFAYTNHRIPIGSDYSETKFLFEQEKGFLGPLKMSGNLGLSFYNKPDPNLQQQRVRDFSAALSFEGSSDSPFTESGNQSKVTYSFVGRYERLFENRQRLNRTPDIGSLQFVTEIPLFKGLSIPFSVTYSSATEEEKKQGFRFNFGTRFDMDKLFALINAGANR
jgi:hypothetical protein